MSINLLATQVPAPQQSSGFLRLLDGQTDSGNAPVSLTIPLGTNGADVPSRFNRLPTGVDLTGRYGGGSYAVAYGLTCCAGAGLLLNVAAGHAIVDGVVELPSDTALNMNDNTTNYVWFKRDGTLQAQNNILDAPLVPGVFIAAVVTASGSIVSIDTSGVCSLRNGWLFRETADPGKPGDTPSSGLVFLTRTLGGTYLWDGRAYNLQVNGLPLAKSSISIGEIVTVPAGYQSQVFDSFSIAGAFTVKGAFRVTA